MKKTTSLVLLITAPLLLALVVWQAGRFTALAAELRALELEQEAWVEENEKLVGGIAVLESRERAARLAEELGLEKAAPERRLFVSTKPAAAGIAGSAAAAGSAGAKPSAAGELPAAEAPVATERSDG